MEEDDWKIAMSAQEGVNRLEVNLEVNEEAETSRQGHLIRDAIAIHLEHNLAGGRP